ncbi:MAG: ArsR family transcriptional regulator [Methanothrix sp.]
MLDERDLEFVDALRNLRVPRSMATLITFLANADEATSRQIEMGTSMRQPEVSIGMRKLRERGWITEREIKHEGKGRPMKIYALGATIDEIINYYEAEKAQESTQTMVAIQRLKELSSA